MLIKAFARSMTASRSGGPVSRRAGLVNDMLPMRTVGAKGRHQANVELRRAGRPGRAGIAIRRVDCRNPIKCRRRRRCPAPGSCRPNTLDAEVDALGRRSGPEVSSKSGAIMSMGIDRRAVVGSQVAEGSPPKAS